MPVQKRGKGQGHAAHCVLARLWRACTRARVRLRSYVCPRACVTRAGTATSVLAAHAGIGDVSTVDEPHILLRMAARHRPGQPERACGWHWGHHMASRAPTQRARALPLPLFHRARQRGVRTSRTSCGGEVCVLSHTSTPATTRLAPTRGASRCGFLCPYHGASQRSTGLNEFRAKQQRHCCRLAELATEHEDDHISNGAQTWRLRCGTRTSC